MSFIKKVPTAMSALALGTAALGNLLLPYSPVVRAACGVMAAALVLLILARAVLDFAGVRAELDNPAALAALPALGMALMLLATYLKPLAAAPAFALWVVALVFQFAVMALFVARHVAAFELKKVVPAWFLVLVGFVVASVTSPAFGAVALGRVLVWAGAAGYVVALGLVVARLARAGDLPEPLLPTVAIFAAPPSLVLVGYLATAEAKTAWVVYALMAAAAASLVFVASRLPRVLRGSFHPSFAALTFPVVISAIALKQCNAFLTGTPGGSFIPGAAVLAMDALATAAVLYVLARYAVFLAPARAPKAEPEAAEA